MSEVVAFGECMVEVGLAEPGRATLAYAGDTFNTAVYLRRQGLEVAYGTAVGDGDPFSAGILQLMAEEGLDDRLVRRRPNRLPGLYAFDRDPAGERRFYYWRAESPARDYFALAEPAVLAAAVRAARLVYVSGVTLAVIGEAGRATLLGLLADARDAGAAVAFDPNYRPQLWESAEAARSAADAAASLCRYVSTSVPDLAGLYGPAAAARPAPWAAQGVEVVVRGEDRAVVVRRDGSEWSFQPEPPVRVLDTTGAGDAFNAGYLAARLRGEDSPSAVAAARRLAGAVVQHVGAIIPRAETPGAEA